jgi:hypothetical protein
LGSQFWRFHSTFSWFQGITVSLPQCTVSLWWDNTSWREHLVKKGAHLMAARKQKRDRKGMGSNISFNSTLPVTSLPSSRRYLLKVLPPPTSALGPCFQYRYLWRIFQIQTIARPESVFRFNSSFFFHYSTFRSSDPVWEYFHHQLVQCPFRILHLILKFLHREDSILYISQIIIHQYVICHITKTIYNTSIIISKT